MALGRWLSAMAGIVLAAACAAPAARPGDRASTSSARPAAEARTITIGLDEDLRNLWNVVTEGAAGSEAQHLLHTFHQPLAANTSDGSPTPRVLQDLPSIERGTWKVFDDGTMTTTWRLRPGVTWQDGTP